MNAGGKYSVVVRVNGIGGVELIGQIELQRSRRPRREIPQEVDQNRGIDGTVLHQPLDVPQEICAAGLRLVIGMPEDSSRLP